MYKVYVNGKYDNYEGSLLACYDFCDEQYGKGKKLDWDFFGGYLPGNDGEYYDNPQIGLYIELIKVDK